MTGPKPRKPAARKTTRSRSGAKSSIDGENTGSFDDDSAAASKPQSNDSKKGEEPLLAIQQVSDADTAGGSTSDQSDQSYSADGADGSDGLDGEIRRRAYEIYLARGGAEGNDLEDWLTAERSVRSRHGGTEQSAKDLSASE
jgi:hypothetical protein